MQARQNFSADSVRDGGGEGMGLIAKLHTLEQENANLRAENERLRTENAQLKTENAALREEIVSLKQIIEQLTATIQKMQCQIDELTAQNKALTTQVKMNSKNSSKPPSSDGLQKPSVPKSLRQPTGKKPGAQMGHQGKGLILPHQPDETHEHMPEQCKTCPKAAECTAQAEVAQRRYEIDVQITTKVTEHDAIQRKCGELGGQVVVGSFPPEISGSIQYGNNLKAFVVALNTRGTLSINRTHEILGGIFDIPISEGTITSMVEEFAGTVSPIVSKIRDELKSKEILHLDETGLRVDGKLHWAHVASDGDYAYIFVHEKRGQEAMDAGEILPEFKGIGVHDCWQPYFKYASFRHALCNGHLIRELQGVIDSTGQAWAEEMISLLVTMKKIREIKIKSGETSASDQMLAIFSRDYDEILQKGFELNPLPPKDPKTGRIKRGKTRALLDRLSTYKAEICLFYKDFSVPWDNNQAERDIRMFKVKQHVSGCFRTKRGADSFAKILSFINSAKKHGLNSYHAILDAIKGNTVFPELS